MQKALKERDPEEYENLMRLYSAAVGELADPEYERAAPPPESKVMGALINAWGVECFKLGLEMGIELAEFVDG